MQGHLEEVHPDRPPHSSPCRRPLAPTPERPDPDARHKLGRIAEQASSANEPEPTGTCRAASDWGRTEDSEQWRGLPGLGEKGDGAQETKGPQRPSLNAVQPRAAPSLFKKKK